MDYIQHIHLEDFRCIKSVDADLTPLHAFIGPNDSGKTTLLNAFKLCLGLLADRFRLNPQSGSNKPSVSAAAPFGEFRFTGQMGFEIRRDVRSPRARVVHAWKDGVSCSSDGSSVYTGKLEAIQKDPAWRRAASVRLLRLDPDAMREPFPIIGARALAEVDERGRGLAGVLDAITSRNPEDFLDIQRKFVELFPTVARLRLEVPKEGTKQLALTLKDGTNVRAEEMSEGMLHFLGIASLVYLEPVSVVLVEEPENGLHPARISEVVRVLRRVSESSQVLVATHSPLVINEFHDDEVTLVTRSEQKGTILTPIAKTLNFQERSKVYALGELWLSYADGCGESGLVPEAGKEVVA